MGQQQLLLIILAAIIVGVAVAVGILLFRTTAVDSARDAVVNDLTDLASRAQAYYRKPASMAGGAKSFLNHSTGSLMPISRLTNKPYNENGRYFIDGSSTGQRLVLIGKGREVVGTDTIEVRTTVTQDSIITVIIH